MTLKENEEEVGEDQCPGLIIYHDQQQLSNSLVQRPLRSPSNGSLAVQKEKDHDIVNAAPDPKIESKTVDDMTAAILPGLSKPKKQAKKVNSKRFLADLVYKLSQVHDILTRHKVNFIL